MFKHLLRFYPLLVALTYAQENTNFRYWHGVLIPKSFQQFLVPFLFMLEYWVTLVTLVSPGILGLIVVTYYFTIQKWTRLLS